MSLASPPFYRCWNWGSEREVTWLRTEQCTGLQGPRSSCFPLHSLRREAVPSLSPHPSLGRAPESWWLTSLHSLCFHLHRLPSPKVLADPGPRAVGQGGKLYFVVYFLPLPREALASQLYRLAEGDREAKRSLEISQSGRILAEREGSWRKKLTCIWHPGYAFGFTRIMGPSLLLQEVATATHLICEMRKRMLREMRPCVRSLTTGKGWAWIQHCSPCRVPSTTPQKQVKMSMTLWGASPHPEGA